MSLTERPCIYCGHPGGMSSEHVLGHWILRCGMSSARRKSITSVGSRTLFRGKVSLPPMLWGTPILPARLELESYCSDDGTL
jgi:hypothetical protein